MLIESREFGLLYRVSYYIGDVHFQALTLVATWIFIFFPDYSWDQHMDVILKTNKLTIDEKVQSQPAVASLC